MAGELTRAVGAARSGFYGWIDSAGYTTGASTSLANGSDDGMGVINDIISVDLGFVGADYQATKRGHFFVYESRTPLQFTMEMEIFDPTFHANSIGASVYTQGEIKMVGHMAGSPSRRNGCLVLNADAKAGDSGSDGLARYECVVIPKCIFEVQYFDSFPDNAIARVTVLVTAGISDILPWGESVTSGNYGKTSFRMFSLLSDDPLTIHSFVGDGSTASVTLDYTVAGSDGNHAMLWAGGAAETYTTHYTVSGTTLTYTNPAGIPAAAEKSILLYQYTI